MNYNIETITVILFSLVVLLFIEGFKIRLKPFKIEFDRWFSFIVTVALVAIYVISCNQSRQSGFEKGYYNGFEEGIKYTIKELNRLSKKDSLGVEVEYKKKTK